MFVIRKVFLLFISLVVTTCAHAQNVDWPSPEIEQLYKQARQFHSSGNLKQAITLYKQAIQVAPGVMLLHRELGQALYLSGSYEEAISTLEAVIQAGAADEETYQVMASCLLAKGEKKKARNILKDGMARYPHAGILYYQAGKIYDEDGDREAALKAWLDGIENDPAYHMNYYEAARAYLDTNAPVWAILYGEMFVNIEQQTPRSYDVRKMLLEAYKQLFSSVNASAAPKYGKGKLPVNADFEKAVRDIYIKLSPVVSDGINTENLIMLRTRFIMEWYQQRYQFKYPFTLFARHDDMIRNGYFDIYNQWLFGKVDNAQEYAAWLKFHEDAAPDMEDYLKEHPYRPTGGDFYNSKNMDHIFLKKKKS